MFKFELGQTIYYLRANKLHSAPVLSRTCVENLDNTRYSTTAQIHLHQAFGRDMIAYSTCHGVIRPEEAFGSPEELATYIIGAYNNEH
jgi:hypothetical protein